MLFVLRNWWLLNNIIGEDNLDIMHYADHLCDQGTDRNENNDIFNLKNVSVPTRTWLYLF